jgi:hypothetical protein
VALLALVVGLVVVAVDLRSPSRRGGASTTTTAGSGVAPQQGAQPVPPARPAVPARRLATLVVPEAPTGARLPSGRVVRVQPVSTRSDGTLDVPEDIRTSGWWRGGSRIGDPFGSILVAAHIDSRSQGLGPFAELLSVKPGARVSVTTRHLRQTFTVRSRRLVPQKSLADQRWIFAPDGDARLTLVTCAPPFDATRGGYQKLAVVTAAPVRPPSPGTTGR